MSIQLLLNPQLFVLYYVRIFKNHPIIENLNYYLLIINICTIYYLLNYNIFVFTILLTPIIFYIIINLINDNNNKVIIPKVIKESGPLLNKNDILYDKDDILLNKIDQNKVKIENILSEYTL